FVGTPTARINTITDLSAQVLPATSKAKRQLERLVLNQGERKWGAKTVSSSKRLLALLSRSAPPDVIPPHPMRFLVPGYPPL
ncbi:hypothetical protein VNI00_017932, partial [Paramarasmius palmivorus]